MNKPAALILAIVFAFLFGCGDVKSKTANAEQADATEVQRAPEFTGADGWLNTDKPVSIQDLKGQVVLLDFWTYCCINCMHIFPDLKYLEQKYKDEPVAVIGVHSGKFDEEKDADHIRQAILRHNIEHPVAVDSNMKIWEAYGVHAWPTLVLIKPDGTVLGAVSGEGNRVTLDRAIQNLLDEYKQKGQLGKHLTFRRERESFKSGLLEFPGKVLADAAGHRLFISDTNHHRIVETDLNGRVVTTIGTGTIGLKDGPASEAMFHQPQGLALSADGKTLYVADTENHVVRAVDLGANTVRTIAGDGTQFNRRRPGTEAKATQLSSPWDLARIGDQLYVAMAGTHQIWRIGLTKGDLEVYAGTRAEAAVDGPNEQASFAQPSGLATDGKTLYVADSEASSIRAVDLSANATRTLAGSGQLFGFGLKDGAGAEARFQHPLGLALNGTTLFVADTFNGVIRTIDTSSGEVKTWLGTGKSDPGTSQAPRFYEPGGLSIAGDTLYVADTNHHRIVAVDLKTKASRVIVGPAEK